MADWCIISHMIELLMLIAIQILPADIDPVGACCFKESCELTNEEICLDLGGSWAGPETECSECRTVPVELLSFTVE
jgi:hypothetical protein